MNFYAIESFLTKFGFIENLIKNPNYKLNILDIKNDMSHISGEIKFNSGETSAESIPFETDIIKLEDSLMFKTIYERNGKIFGEKDIFLLMQEKPKIQYNNRKVKFLIHILDNDIKQIYTTGKKYQIENGISENLSKINMKNIDVKKKLEAYKQEIISISTNISSHKK